MAKLSLVFTDLTQGEHDYLMNAFQIISGEDAARQSASAAVAQGYDAARQSASAAVAQGYDAARQHVETRPQAPDVPQAAGPDLDVHDVPYNPAVHTSTRAKRDDGVWAKKKGAGDAYDQWHAQHRRQPAASPQPAPGVPGVPNPVATPPAVIPQPAPVAPPAATVLQQVDYGTWYGAYETAVTTGRMNEGILTMINQQCGVPDASAYAHNDHARMVSYGMLQRLISTGSI